MMRATPEPGTVLAGKFQVDKVLGIGGMGVVVSATHLQLEQKVAIKCLLPEALANPEVVERFAREARAAAKIRGEHVARVIDVGQFDDGAPYMVMEYLEGRDLAKELEERGPLPVTDAVRYLLEACEALAEAHVARIVHRDLKPSNLFLATQPGGRAIVKVLDFGISKIDGAPSAALTRTSAMMGTAYYMSPEQLTRPKEVDARSDIWALGVILYELLTGRPPFVGETVPEVIGAILQNEPTPIQELRRDIPPALAEVIGQCLQAKAAARYASVAAFADALAPFALEADRMSIDAISRVLGHTTGRHSAVASAYSKETVNERGPRMPSTPVEAASRPSSDPPRDGARGAPGPDRAGLESSVTALAQSTKLSLAASVESTASKKSSLPLVLGGVAAAALIAVAAFALRGGGGASTTTQAATGLVPSAPSAPVAVDPVPMPKVDPAPSTSTTLTPIAAPSAVSVKAVEPAAVPVKVAKPTAKPTTTTTTTTKPASAPTTAATAPTTPKNPLNMGIK